MAYRNPAKTGGSSTGLLIGGVVVLAAAGGALFLFRDTIFAGGGGGGNGDGGGTLPPPPVTITAGQAVFLGENRAFQTYPSPAFTYFGPSRNVKITGQPSGMSSSQWSQITAATGGNIYWYTEFHFRDESTGSEFWVHTVIDAVNGDIVRFGNGKLTQLGV